MPADPYEAARQAQRGAVARRKRRLRRSGTAAAGSTAGTARLAGSADPAGPAHLADPAGPAKPTGLAVTGPLPAGSPTQRQGRAAEARAARHLEARGVRILAVNLRCRAGEIDLVAREGAVLLFIEVRERRNPVFGGAAASVNRSKQARLIRAAHHFLPRLARLHFGGATPACRFDVVAFEADRPRWIRDAFRA
ncbi:YraN family protein [Castellaniella defragrans]|uniref:YraN family protein n=1 Tax=Castellaniella defragrans TaxID=75697 RepID=UPI0023F4E341|nr:YraN family protein [Castellaniella defragrans]